MISIQITPLGHTDVVGASRLTHVLINTYGMAVNSFYIL